MFATVGVFFEYEEWKQPFPNAQVGRYAHSRKVKTHLSLGFRHQLADQWELTTTAIYQATPDSHFTRPRWWGAVDLKYRITPTIGIRGTYRLIYDTYPIVPIRRDYNVVDAGIDFSF